MSKMIFSENFFGSLHCYGPGEITTKVKIQNSHAWRQDSGPTCGFVTSLKVGLGASVSTLQTRYPRI
jgi:hypothetical protein